jgi:homoserine dehydrogenase
VLAAISNEFAKHDVSIQAVRQDGQGDAANLIIRTHQAPESRLRATVEALENMKAVREVLGVMRVEGAGA